MKKYMAALLLLVALALLPLQVVGQSGGGEVIQLNPDEVREQLDIVHLDLVDLNNQTTVIRHIQAFNEADNADEQRQVVFELSEYCLERGLRPAPDLAELFLSMAAEQETTGRTEDFRRMAGFAETFDPTHPGVPLSFADVARRQHGVFSGAFAFETLNAVFLSFRSTVSRPVALANLGTWLRITAFLLLTILSLLLLLRYHPLIRHDVLEWLGGQDTTLNKVAGWVVIFLPSLLFLSGFWWVVFWCGLFALYATKPERFAILAASAIFVASGIFSLWVNQNLYLGLSRPHVSNLSSYDNRLDVGPDRYLVGLSEEEGIDGDIYSFLLASRYMVHGSYHQSEQLFRRILKGDPANAEAANNLGCILYYQGRYQEAIQQFNLAVDAQRDLAVAYFNRSLAKTKLFNFSEAKEDQDIARQFDRNISNRFRYLHEDDPVPLPTYLPKAETYRMAVREENTTGRVNALPEKPTASWIPFIYRANFSLPLIAFILIALVLGFSKGRAFFARACFKCGRPYCSLCKTSLEFESFCAQCVHLYIKQDGVSPEARLKKNYEVEIHNRAMKIVRGILSILAPGAGHFVEGRPLSSLFLLLLWCGLLAGFILRYFAIPFPFTTSPEPLYAAYNVVGAVCMAALWLIFGLPRALSRQLPQPIGYSSGRKK